MPYSPPIRTLVDFEFTINSSSRSFDFEFNPATIPFFIIQPTDQTTTVGDVATFSSTVSGSGLSYQWQEHSA
jgi:hypothetical protein